MGCTASRPAFDDELSPVQHDYYHPSFSKGISMPAPLYSHSPSLHDFNIVPLSSCTYGINMKVADHDGQKVFGHGDAKKEESIKEMLQVLESLDIGGVIGDTPAPPSIFDDLKPGLEKHFNQALGKSSETDTIPPSPIQGKENAKPPPLSPSIGPNSPSRYKGSASPKVCKPKSSFASRFLKRTSSAVGSQKNEGVTDDQDASVRSAPHKLESSGSIFDSEFMASYESALKELTQNDWNALKHDAEQPQQIVDSPKREGGEMVQAQPQPQIPTPVKKKPEDPLEKYELLCPPGGDHSVVLYSTSLRGIRKTFEDCSSLRSLLESFQVIVGERDVAMHQGFRNELREMMGNKPVPVPRLFIKGRYIGGAEEVLQLHEEQQLAPLLQDVPLDQRGVAQPCDGCGGARFVLCMDCNGSRKVVYPDNPKEVIRCPDCNENGLIQCPICS